jgi:adenosylcobinamide-GDP ribazoletransferase
VALTGLRATLALLTGLRAALALLTRLPVAGRSPADAPAPGLGPALPWFGVVGALVGLAVAGGYAAARAVLPAVVAALLAVALGLLLTGALHEDGLADVADALAAGDPQAARRALKDPTLGTFGVSALVVALGLRVTALASLDMPVALLVVPAAAALSRGAVAALLAIPAQGATGLGAAAAAQATPTRLVTAVTVAVAIATALLGAWVLPGVALTALAVAAVAWLAVRRLTVITGDVLGAAQQVADLLVLVAAVAVTGAGGRPVAWWF